MNQEDILDKAISQMKKGNTVSQAFGNGEMADPELATIAAMLSSLPIQPVPQPALRRSYAKMAERAQSFFAMFYFHRHAAFALGMLLIITLGSTTVYGAATSVPGEKLFALKKGAEQLRVKFESDELEKANLQMAITKKRLAEAEKIINSESKNPQQEIAALNELANQSRSTIEQVETAAKNNQLQETNHPVIASLEAMNKEQQAFITQLPPEKDSIKTAAANILESTKENESKVAHIKTIVEVVAASKEQTLITLSPDPNSILVSGTVDASSKEKLTVEKNTFLVTPETVFKDSAGRVLATTTLAIGLKVTVHGQKDDNKLIATQVGILAIPGQIEPEPKVQGTSTQSSLGKTSTTPVTTKKIEPQPSTTPENLETEPPVDENPARALFIPEDPSPQFVP